MSFSKIAKTIICALISIAILGTLFIVSLFINQNFLIRWKLTSDFKDLICENSHIEIIETKSTHGKLNGNGNGINYFGTVLVKTDSKDTLKELLALLDTEFDTVGYVTQINQTIENNLLEHTTLEYNTPLTNGEIYYSIFYFNHTNKYSYQLDIRGF